MTRKEWPAAPGKCRECGQIVRSLEHHYRSTHQSSCRVVLDGTIHDVFRDHEVGLFRCLRCAKPFQTPRKLQDHMRRDSCSRSQTPPTRSQPVPTGSPGRIRIKMRKPGVGDPDSQDANKPEHRRSGPTKRRPSLVLTLPGRKRPKLDDTNDPVTDPGRQPSLVRDEAAEPVSSTEEPRPPPTPPDSHPISTPSDSQPVLPAPSDSQLGHEPSRSPSLHPPSESEPQAAIGLTAPSESQPIEPDDTMRDPHGSTTPEPEEDRPGVEEPVLDNSGSQSVGSAPSPEPHPIVEAFDSQGVREESLDPPTAVPASIEQQPISTSSELIVASGPVESEEPQASPDPAAVRAACDLQPESMPLESLGTPADDPAVPGLSEREPEPSSETMGSPPLPVPLELPESGATSPPLDLQAPDLSSSFPEPDPQTHTADDPQSPHIDASETGMDVDAVQLDALELQYPDDDDDDIAMADVQDAEGSIEEAVNGDVFAAAGPRPWQAEADPDDIRTVHEPPMDGPYPAFVVAPASHHAIDDATTLRRNSTFWRARSQGVATGTTWKKNCARRRGTMRGGCA
ncbi:uncharacterized protein B0H18DRAFT_996358 [Fomitopsis serialis]|uniref:uncharacterized protein n=1 Tax=Fomitopsis serialis TaxID=139415 RepID=UPI0020084677|nr:uncharacterized protein B0H18DRAFT_996358 [Neoantrodia serialis]KAH9929810.1 hypothetical protein B0H18DRAFT_996358 [Neoantrodia serialis]